MKVEVLSGVRTNEVYRILFVRLGEKIIVLSYSYEDNSDSEFAGVTDFIAKELNVELFNICHVDGNNQWDADYWHDNLV